MMWFPYFINERFFFLNFENNRKCSIVIVSSYTVTPLYAVISHFIPLFFYPCTSKYGQGKKIGHVASIKYNDIL